MDHAEDAAAVGQAQRRAAGARDLVDRGAERRRLGDILPGLLAREFEHRIDRALAQLAAPISTPDSRVVAENSMNLASAGAAWRRTLYFSCTSVMMERPSAVSSASLASKRRFRRLALGHARHHNDFGRQPVAEGDGAGLVEQ